MYNFIKLPVGRGCEIEFDIIERVYKKAEASGDGGPFEAGLAIRLFIPRRGELKKPRPAVVFFFGGGFETGSIEQFKPHSERLASIGIAAATAEYRIKSKHGTTPVESIRDAKDALCYVKRNADEFFIDPKRILVSGGSSGGYLAAACALLTGAEYDSGGVSEIPAALVLFNPLLDALSGIGKKMMGGLAAELDLISKVRKNQPPALILHGEDDSVTPIEASFIFQQKSRALGAECEIVSYPKRGHGFFNYGVEPDNGIYHATHAELEKFCARF
ncbi:MAG: alpha/beta hydrolase [Defluviitaleaceae bacterium]|nr:alpha/beta hydrolase [Defluviitaleaceae bacterium]